MTRDTAERARELAIRRIKRLPRYPYHTWDAGRTKESQELIGLDDVLAALAQALQPGEKEENHD